MFSVCLRQGSSEPEPVWCTSLKFRFCRQSCAWRPPPKLAQLGGRRTLPTCLANDAFRRKRSKLPPVDQPDWCSVGDHQSPVCRLTPYRISRLKMQNRQTGRSARPSVIETPYPVHLPPWRKANRISMEWMKILQSIDLAHVQQGLYLGCKHRAGDLLPQFPAPAPTARERRSG